MPHRRSKRDSQSPPFNVRALAADADTVVAGPRFSAAVLSMFAFVAFAMACVGVYGVMSYAARLRTREIGVRLAVGATRMQVLALMMKSGGLVVALGLATGLVAAFRRDLFRLSLPSEVHDDVVFILADRLNGEPASLSGHHHLLETLRLFECFERDDLRKTFHEPDVDHVPDGLGLP